MDFDEFDLEDIYYPDGALSAVAGNSEYMDEAKDAYQSTRDTMQKMRPEVEQKRAKLLSAIDRLIANSAYRQDPTARRRAYIDGLRETGTIYSKFGKMPMNMGALEGMYADDKRRADEITARQAADIAQGKLGVEREKLGVGFTDTDTENLMKQAKLALDMARAGRTGVGKGTEFERLSAKVAAGTATPEEKLRVETMARGGMDSEKRAEGSTMGKKRAEKLADLEEVALNAQAAYADLDMIDDAIEKIGGMQGYGRGWIPNISPEAQKLDSASTTEALKYVNATKGAVSDREMAMFKGASMGTDKDINFNRNKSKAARAIIIRSEQQADFLNAWRNKYGTLDGGVKAFKKFAEENPIFEVKDGKFKFLRDVEDIKNDESYMNYLEKNGEGGGTTPAKKDATKTNYKSKYGLD